MFALSQSPVHLKSPLFGARFEVGVTISPTDRKIKNDEFEQVLERALKEDEDLRETADKWFITRDPQNNIINFVCFEEVKDSFTNFIKRNCTGIFDNKVLSNVFFSAKNISNGEMINTSDELAAQKPILPRT
jgi:hypothetical protein